MYVKSIFAVLFLSFTLLMNISECSLFSNTENIMSPLPKVKNSFKPIMIWRHSVGHGTGKYYSNLHPAWHGDSVFVADRHGLIKALDHHLGKEIWSSDLSIVSKMLHNRPALLSGGVSVTNNLVYVGSELAKVYALNAEDGSLVWQTTVAGEVLSTPVISDIDGVLIVHTGNGKLQALNELDGSIKWTVNLGMPMLTLRGKSSPIIFFDMVIVGGDNGIVSAVLINQGKIIWQQQMSQSHHHHNIGSKERTSINDIKTTPVVVNGVVYALAYNGLAAMDLNSGKVMWSREIGAAVTNMLVSDGCIYLFDKNDQVIAVDIKDGTTLWCKTELLHRNLTAPVMYKGYIITGDSKGYLHWINTKNGNFIAQQKVDSSGLLSIPIVARNKLIVQAKNGAVYAFT